MLRCGKVGLTSALEAPLRGEVLVDQHDLAFKCKPTTQSSMGRPLVTSSHGRREFRVSIRKHHRVISPILALGCQTVDYVFFDSLLLAFQQEAPLDKSHSPVHPPQRCPRPGLPQEGRSESFDVQHLDGALHRQAAKRTFHPLLEAPQSRLLPIRTVANRRQRLPLLAFDERRAAGDPDIAMARVDHDDGWKFCDRCGGLDGCLRKEVAVSVCPD